MKLIRCLDCKKIGPKTPCDDCKAKRARDRATAGRGALTHEHYDAEYIRNRKLMMQWAEEAQHMPLYCCICSQRIKMLSDISIEHIVPVARGGTSAMSNLGYAHKKCNYGNRHNRRRKA